MKKRTAIILVVALVFGAGLIGVFSRATGARGARTAAPAGGWSATSLAALLSPDTAWTVGELRENGLRIIPSGRSDASAVLDPEQFENPTVRHAYWVATQIPETLNQLYCWCGCENRGIHRSNLQCFEDRMGANCDVCVGTAEIAYEMVQDGVTDAGTIQAAVDAEWGPKS
ncbi:MAG: PCYCGC motif-containing (lipo)protein [Longimicrobiaceae bacterium]